MAKLINLNRSLRTSSGWKFADPIMEETNSITFTLYQITSSFKEPDFLQVKTVSNNIQGP